MKKIFLAIILLAFTCSAFAAQTSTQKTQELQQLMQVMGVKAQLQGVVGKFRQQQKLVGAMVLRRLQVRYPKLSDSQKQQLQQVVQDFTKKVSSTLEPDAIVKQWVSYMSDELTQPEVKKLVTFYSSDLGKKIIVAQQKAESKMVQYLLGQQRGSVLKARTELVEKVKKIVKE